MKKTMKLVSLILAMLMLVACAAACGGGGNEGKEEKKVLNIYLGADCETMNAHATPSSTPSTPYSYCSAFLWRSAPGDNADLGFTGLGYHYVPDLATGMPVVVSAVEQEYKKWAPVTDANGDAVEGQYTYTTEKAVMQTWEFEIREEAKWQNGDKLTAEEIVWGWQQLANPDLANAMSDFLSYNFKILNTDAYRWGQCGWDEVGIKVNGNKIQVTIVGETDLVKFCGNFNDRSLQPVKKSIYEKGTWGNDVKENWMGCGPYKFETWTVDSVQTYVKDESYWLADMFHWDQVNVYIVPEMNSRVQMFESEQLDTLVPDANTIDKYLDDPRMTIYGSTTVEHIDVNCKNKTNPLASGNKETQVNYRKALYHALDRETIAYKLMGQMQAVGTYVNAQAGLLSASGLTYRDSSYGKAVTDMVATWSEEGHTTGYNRAKAVDYMKAAFEGAGLNWADDSKITLKLVLDLSDGTWKDVAPFIQEEFPKIFVNDAGNVKVDVEIKGQGNMSSTAMKKPVDQGGFGDDGWDLSPNEWARSASRTDPYQCFYYYTNQYQSAPNNYFSDKFNQQFAACQKLVDEKASYDQMLAACQKLEEIYLEEVIHLPVAQTVNYELFAEKIVLPTEKYIPGYGWGLIYGDIAE